MSFDNNKAIARRYIVDAVPDPAIYDEVLAEDAVFYYPGLPGPLHGRAALKGLDTAYRTAFPDYRVTLDDDLLAEGDKVVGRWTMRGTHSGSFNGIPATGRAVSITGINILRIANGQVVEDWGAFDLLGLMQQVGAFPS